MTKEQTAQQLKLAAQILRTGHPWEYRHIAGSRYKYNTPIEVVADGNFLSPLLATPPDNRPLHNPDNLTAEQVGVGYRLALPGESAASPHDFWDGNTWKKAKLELRESRKVNRSIPLTGKWNPDAWEPCSKTIPADENLAEPKSR